MPAADHDDIVVGLRLVAHQKISPLSLGQIMARVLLLLSRTHDDTRCAEIARRTIGLRGRSVYAGGSTRSGWGFPEEEGWRPAVLGTGGIQEDRMPGASNPSSGAGQTPADAASPSVVGERIPTATVMKL